MQFFFFLKKIYNLRNNHWSLVLNQEKVVITFLGSGSAFSVGNQNYQSNILLTSNSSNLLIDCGGDIRHSLHEQGLNYNDIHEVYISHLHGDHVGGLEWLGLNRRFNSQLPKPILHISDALVDKLWSKVLSGGMETLLNKLANLDDYFNVNLIAENSYFTWNHIKFHLVRTQHYFSNNQLAPSFGLFFYCNDKEIFITTDTQFTPEKFMEFYTKADLIFHDCTIGRFCGVHSHYDQLKTLDDQIKSKIWLYHYDSSDLPNANADGFLGLVKKGQKFY